MFQIVLGLVLTLVVSLGGFGGYEKFRADRAEANARIAQQQLALAKQRADDLARLWTATLADAQSQYDSQRKDTDAKFTALQARASALAKRLVSVSGQLDRVLRDATAAANTHAAPAPAKRDERPDTVPATPATVTYTEAQIAQWATAAAAAYADAWGKWNSCVKTYERLRAQQMEQSQ